MSADDLLSIPGGMIGGFFWMGICWAAFRGRSDSDVIAFKAMAFLMIVTTVLAGVFPQFAVPEPKGALITVGYLLVMAWFWKSRGLDLVQGKAENA